MKKLRELLSRKTSGGPVISEIDGFRFFAIFTVVLYHLNTHFTRSLALELPSDFANSYLFKILSRGSVGVDVFFAISGFILALPFASQHLLEAKRVNLKSYYVRRVTRLEPPYVISIILFLFVHLLILHEHPNGIFPNFLASLFYAHSIVFDEWSKINPVAWSLEVEVQFYILAPVLSLFFRIKESGWRRLILITIVIGSVLHYNLNYDLIQVLHLRKSLVMHLHQFLIGFLFADFFLTDWKEYLKSKSYGYDLVGIASLSLLIVFNDPFDVIHDLIFIFCVLTSFIALFKGKLMNSFFTNPWIVIVGGMCYSIYLLHYALIAFLINKTKVLFFPDWSYESNFAIQASLVIPVVLLISSIYFVLIERPCMDKEWPYKLKSKILSVFTAPVR